MRCPGLSIVPASTSQSNTHTVPHPYGSVASGFLLGTPELTASTVVLLGVTAAAAFLLSAAFSSISLGSTTSH
ncbi:hypothetical protein MHYP_G00157150 [Metynnis hypsauchen]